MASVLYAVLLLAFLSTWSVKALEDSDTDEHWEHFKEKYDKSYENEEEEQEGRDNFDKNLIQASFQNMVNPSGQKSGVNSFSDRDPDEVIRTMCKTMVSTAEDPGHIRNFTEEATESYVNWTEKGVVSPVRDQANCGSCWAFGAVQALESQCAIANGQLVQGSPQQLVDCAREQYGNHGCMGGFPTKAYLYFNDTPSVVEKSYAYRGVDSPCTVPFNAQTQGITDYVVVGPKGDEKALARAVQEMGPMVVALDATQNFVKYVSGIFSDPKCSQKPNHAVLLVGYGSEDDNDYWIIKNSWGPAWGENGYMRLARNQDNMCAIATYASYPICKQ